MSVLASKLVRRSFRVLGAVLLLGAAACGTTRQDVRFSGTAPTLDHWVEFDPGPLSIAKCQRLSAQARDSFDSELRAELSRADMLGRGDGTWRLKARCETFEVSGGAGNKVLAASGDARLVIALDILDAAGNLQGTVRSTETTRVEGLFPKVSDQPFGAASARSFAEQLKARRRASFD